MALLIFKSLTLLAIILAIIEVVLTDSASEDFIKKTCNEKLEFKSIAEFNIFFRHFKDLTENGYIDFKEDKLLSRCLEEKSSIYALEQLVTNYDKKRPCKWQEIIKLEKYAKTYFADKKNRPMSLKFYTLFGVNVGFVCKMNLLAHINQADMEVDQVDFIYSMASPTGWNVLINEYTKKSLKFGSSSNTEGSLINRIAKLIPGLTLIEEVDYMNFDHIMNHNIVKDWNGVENGTFESNDLKSSQHLIKCVTKIIESCKKLDQFYFNSILSLARLKNLGLLVNFDMLSSQHEHSLMLHKWLAATSFCQLMVRVRVKKVENNDKVIGIEIFHEDTLIESRQKLYSYVAEFEDINAIAVEKAWLASVTEGNWCRRDKAIFKKVEGAETESVAMKKLKQLMKGLERDYVASLKAS